MPRAVTFMDLYRRHSRLEEPTERDNCMAQEDPSKRVANRRLEQPPCWLAESPLRWLGHGGLSDRPSDKLNVSWGARNDPTAPLGLITVAALLCPSGRYVIDRKTLTDSDLAGAEHLKASAF
jgi:hypothetical protein